MPNEWRIFETYPCLKNTQGTHVQFSKVDKELSSLGPFSGNYDISFAFGIIHVSGGRNILHN